MSLKKLNIRWQLVGYDCLILLVWNLILMLQSRISLQYGLIQLVLSLVCVFTARLVGGIYQQILRYGGVQCYLHFLIVDGLAFLLHWLLSIIVGLNIPMTLVLSISSMSAISSLIIRMAYRYAYKYGGTDTSEGRLLRWLLKIFAGPGVECERKEDHKQIKIAIIGAGDTGVALAAELLNNGSAAYTPRCFVDVSKEKVDRKVQGIPVLLEDEATLERLKEYEIQEVVFALPNLQEDRKKELYDYYAQAGYKIKVYDYPVMQTAGSRRHMREFDVEELLFRKPIEMYDERTNAYYKDKVILITGGGGSIGSELCRQLAKMQPKQIIILDIYENGVYDVQQELRIAYSGKLDIQVEITSICNKRAMARIFHMYHPQIVINAAAHKHVPLMERNCIEAVENNVFGTKIIVDLCEEYGTERFMMVSTDKAVNPTNVMGATKRMCEMIVQSASTYGKVKYSCTRFGNVLGSAGSVIPLFKKQIANGGPITLTDKRIIRYFMTIPEASQLVLQSGAMADNGELFVLDMGQPVRILDLAENMIRLSGAKDIEIVETGLRPGEKLYEELLVKTEELTQTENKLIFIERDEAFSKAEIDEKLKQLETACSSNDDDLLRDTLRQVVNTYKTPEEVNALAEDADEMKMQRESRDVVVA